jgi:SAM-dependent methyltransferase
VTRSLEGLLAEAESAPIRGWDFSWLDGRATEERPPWGYSRLLGPRMAQADAALDVQTGGGELLAGLDRVPPLMVATEGWMPNLEIARRRLEPRGAFVVGAHDDRPGLPFRGDLFDLVVSRHPVTTWWDEIARVLRPGGAFLSQQVGPDSVKELAEALRGPLPPSTARSPERAVAAAGDAGLQVVDLREASLRTVFYDVGAVVYFLRLVVWIVPDFGVERYRRQLESLHEVMEAEGSFVTYSRRFLIEARKPA